MTRRCGGALRSGRADVLKCGCIGISMRRRFNARPRLPRRARLRSQRPTRRGRISPHALGNRHAGAHALRR
ncbi:hypothetical protein FFM54_03880 [Burkholderia pseudomallei]|nr:hypothetical protein FFM54_03880 [Burkholderia pseudomallei]